MNLGTHIFFAGVITAIFTGNPYFTLLAGIGSFIPDLDREYLLVTRKTFRKEQFHRALFHSLFFLSALFFVNPWLCLGAFLHSFLDSFTTEKDKGVEWLFPFSRIVKRGRFTLSAKSKGKVCQLELVDQKPSDPICFLNEDSPEMTKISDPDLVESKPLPWRRTYGPAANNQIFDKCVALCSFSLLIVYSLINFDFGLGGRDLLFSSRMIVPMSLLTGIVLIYMGGWLRRNKKLKKGYLVLFVIGGIFIILSGIFSAGSYKFPFNPILVLIVLGVISVEVVLVWRLSIRGGRKALV